MPRLRFTVLMAIMLVVPSLTFLAASPAPSPVDEHHSVADVLKLFPGYHVLSLTERDADVRTFFRQQYPNQNASVIRADFDAMAR